MRAQRILYCVILGLLVALATVGCSDYAAQNEYQTRQVVNSIVKNQPIPNLGGFSFEREMARQTLIARNRDVVSTYTYQIVPSMGKPQIIEICPSLGYPIPYGVELTSPTLPEANSLYYPSSADATWVNCVNDDGSVTPVYWEDHVSALPYRIQADIVLDRTTNPKFKLDPTKNNGN